MTFRPFASAGFDPALIDRTSWTNFGLYCQEAGLYISPVLTDQQAAREHFSAIMETCNADFYWSDGLLKVGTYGDQAIGGWTPTLTPAFALTLQDIIPPSDGEPAISITLMAPTDACNQCTIEWRNRALDYASSTITAKNDEMISLHGLRAEDAVQCHHVCVAETAAMMAQMRVQRKSMLRDTYQFSLPSRYACLEPMVDLLTLTDPLLGLDHKLVRIVTIVERPDGILDITAEGTEIGVCTAIETPSPDPYGYFPDVENLPPGAGGAGSPPLPPAVPMTTLQLPSEFTALDNASTRAGNLTADWTSQAADLIFGTHTSGLPEFLTATQARGVLEVEQYADYATVEINFAYGDASPLALYTIPTSPAKTCWAVALAIDTPFNGTSPSLTIGDVGDADRLMAATQNDPTTAGTYTTNPAHVYAAGSVITLTIVPGAGASAGSGKIQLFF